MEFIPVTSSDDTYFQKLRIADWIAWVREEQFVRETYGIKRMSDAAFDELKQCKT